MRRNLAEKLAAWAALEKVASRLDAVRNMARTTGTHAAGDVAHAARTAAPDIRSRLMFLPTPSAKGRSAQEILLGTGGTPTAAHAVPPPAAPALRGATGKAELTARFEGRAPLQGAVPEGVDPAIAAQNAQQTAAAVKNNALFNSIHRTNVAAPAPANPFRAAGGVVAPPSSILQTTERQRAQAARAVNSLGASDTLADSQARAREALINARLARPRVSTASAGPDGAIVRKTTFGGIPVFVETDVGQARHWKDPESGEDRATIMRFPYGYIPETRGMDDGSVDVFLGPVSSAKNAYVILINKAGTFDEPDEEKVLLGFTNLYDAVGAFLQHYGNEERFIRKVSVVPISDLAKSLLRDGVTGTAEGGTKKPDEPAAESDGDGDDGGLQKDPTSTIVSALEEKPKKFDEREVKVAAAYLTRKFAARLKLAEQEVCDPGQPIVQGTVVDPTIYLDTDDAFRAVDEQTSRAAGTIIATTG